MSTIRKIPQLIRRTSGSDKRSQLPRPHGNGTSANPQQTQPTTSSHLLKLLLGRNLVLVSALSEVVHADDYDELCNTILPLFEEQQQSLRLIRHTLREQIQSSAYNSSNSNTLFRGMSVAARLVSLYCKKHGKDYLSLILTPTLQQVIPQGLSVEVDPKRLELSDKLANNQKLLKRICRELLATISRSITKCPNELRLIFYYSRVEVRERFPEMTQQVVAGFFFLRFLCPALVSPENYDLITSNVTLNPRNRRSLVLISKVLQNLANDVEFGEKEPYMIVFNKFVMKQRKVVQDIIAELTNMDDVDYTPPPEVIEENERISALTNLGRILVHNEDAVGQILVRGNHIRELEKLNSGLKQYRSGVTGLHAVHKELILKRETDTARKEAISHEKERILLQGGTTASSAPLTSLKDLLEPTNSSTSSPTDSKEIQATTESGSFLQVPLSLSELNAAIGDRLQKTSVTPRAPNSPGHHADAAASAQLINILRDALVSEAHAQKALEAAIKLLRVKLDAEVAARKALQDKLRRLRQRTEEEIEAMVEERVQFRLAQKREKMSEVMANFLNKLGPSAGIDTGKARSASGPERSPLAYSSPPTTVRADGATYMTSHHPLSPSMSIHSSTFISQATDYDDVDDPDYEDDQYYEDELDYGDGDDVYDDDYED